MGAQGHQGLDIQGCRPESAFSASLSQTKGSEKLCDGRGSLVLVIPANSSPPCCGCSGILQGTDVPSLPSPTAVF